MEVSPCEWLPWDTLARKCPKLVSVELEMERRPRGQKAKTSSHKVAYRGAEMCHLEAAQKVGWPDLAHKNIGRQLNRNVRYT